MLIDNTKDIYVGETPITKVYSGSNVVYEKQTTPPYTELEYIESTGTQYIDTLINGNDLAEYEITFDTTGRSARSWEQYFGGNRNTQGYAPKIFYGAPDVVLQQGSTIDIHIGTLSSGILNVEVSSNGIYCNNVFYKNYTLSPWGELTFYIFSAHGEANLMSSMRLYKLVMYSNGEKVRDYIPVLDENNVPCLYDKVSETYFYNQGTGEFIYG